MPYILITSDQSSINEKIVAAIDIVKFRLGEGQWPLYRATPFLDDLKKEDNCLVYLAGKNQFSQHFVSHFEILEVRFPLGLTLKDGGGAQRAPPPPLVFSISFFL